MRSIAALLLLFACAAANAATVYVSEFGNFQGLYQAALVPEITHQTIAITGASVLSNAFNVGTHLIRVESDATCSVQIGGNSPIATATSMRVSAGVPEYFIVQPGQRLAVITNN